MDQEELISGLLEGRSDAMLGLYQAHKEAVDKACAFLLGDEMEAPKAVAQTFRAAALQFKTKGLPAMPLEPWLTSLAALECYKVLRQARQDFESQTQKLELLANRIPVLLEITPDSRERVNFMVRAELDDIPEPHRQILSMNELEGLNLLEMSKRLQCAWLTTLKRLFRAREVLAAQAQAKVKD